MLRLVPDRIFESIRDIDIAVLEKENIHALILDIDNTLAPRHADLPDEAIVTWVEGLKKADVKLYIISNNHQNRVARISKSLGLPFRCNGLKPFPHSFHRAVEEMSENRENCAAVGDQIFTDVLGSRLAGVKAWLVKPIDNNDGVLLKIRRYFESPFIKKYYTENGGSAN